MFWIESILTLIAVMYTLDSILKQVFDETNDMHVLLVIVFQVALSISLLFYSLIFLLLLFSEPDNSHLWLLYTLMMASIVFIELFLYERRAYVSSIFKIYTIKYGLIIGGVYIFYMSNAFMESYMSVITHVSSSNFTTFIRAISLVYSFHFWLVLLQLPLMLLGYYYLFKYPVDSHSDEFSITRNTKYIYGANFILTGGFLSLMLFFMISNKVLPYMINDRFVMDMFHSNVDAFDEEICLKIKLKEGVDSEHHVMFLLNGDVLVYEGMREEKVKANKIGDEKEELKKNKDYPVFVPQECNRKNSTKTS